MSELTITHPIPHTDTEYQSAIEALFAEMDRSHARMQQEQARIQRLKTEAQLLKAETAAIKAQTQARLEALAKMVV